MVPFLLTIFHSMLHILILREEKIMEQKITNFRCLDLNPTFRKASEYLGIHLEDIDENFGIKELDPEIGIYSVRILRKHINQNVSS